MLPHGIMWVLAIMLLGGSAAGDTTAEANTPQARRFDHDADQARMFTRLMKRGDRPSVDYVLERVDRGLPPKSLGAFVDGARATPNDAYAPALRRLSSYRNESIRARALAAMAATDRALGSEAALIAMEDTSLQIRLLGVYLAQTHTAPDVEEALLRLLARDEAVAKAVRSR